MICQLFSGGNRFEISGSTSMNGPDFIVTADEDEIIEGTPSARILFPKKKIRSSNRAFLVESY